MKQMTRYVLFVCGHNAGRSQMAQAFFNRDKKEFPAVDLSYEAISAGTRHGDNVNPLVVQAVAESGIDMSDKTIYFPKGLDSSFVQARAGAIEKIIVACDDKCDLPSGARKGLVPEYWKLPDPHQQQLAVVKHVRDLTKERVHSLLVELNKSLYT